MKTKTPKPWKIAVLRLFKDKKALLGLLLHDQWITRDQARAELDRMDPFWAKSPEARGMVSEFISALDHGDPYFRESAAEILGLTGDGSAVAPLAGLLSDPIPRIAAIKALGRIRDRRAIACLLAARRDGYRNRRKDIRRALNRIDPEWPQSAEARQQVPELIGALDGHEQEARISAAELLGWIPDPRAVIPLYKALRDENVTVRRTALDALDKIGPLCRGELRKIKPDLLAGLNDGHEQVRKISVILLCMLEDADTVLPLFEAMAAGDRETRAMTADALDRINPAWNRDLRDRIPRFIKDLEGHDAEARLKSVDILGLIGDESAADALFDALFDPNEAVRMAAATALKRITPEFFTKMGGYGLFKKGKAAVSDKNGLFMDRLSQKRETLLEFLNDALFNPNEAVRITAAIALKQISPEFFTKMSGYGLFKKGKAAISDKGRLFMGRLSQNRETLFECLGHDNRKTRDSAKASLDRTDSSWRNEIRSRIPEHIAGLKDENEDVRKMSAELLGLAGDDRAVNPLVEALADRNSDVRKSAAESLDRVNPSRHWRRLLNAAANVDALKDPDRHTRVTAAEALGLIGDALAVKPLLKALDDPYENVREAAVGSLNRIDPDWAGEMVGALMKSVSNGTPQTRRIAVSLLGLIGDAKAAATLILEYRHFQTRFDKLKSDDFWDSFLVGTLDEVILDIGKWLTENSLVERSYVGKAISRVMMSNKRFARNNKTLFCKRCLVRAKKIIIPKEDEDVRPPSFWVCAECESTQGLFTGIETAVGVIGGDLRELERDDTTVRFPVWDELEKKARRADIDTLEIRAGGVENHHFAVNAVIIELTSRNSKRKFDAKKKIRVRIVGNPALSKGVVNMLKDFGSSLTEEIPSPTEGTETTEIFSP